MKSVTNDLHSVPSDLYKLSIKSRKSFVCDNLEYNEKRFFHASILDC